MAKKPKRRISVQSAKAKGRSFQQKIRDMFRAVSDKYESRLTTPDEIESRQMGGAGEDVRFLTKIAHKLFPFYIECKSNRRGFNPHKFFEKLVEIAAQDDKKCGRGYSCSPLLFHKEDRGRALVTMDADLWMRMIALFYEVEPGQIVPLAGLLEEEKK